jgi:predicted dehydrogenase
MAHPDRRTFLSGAAAGMSWAAAQAALGNARRFTGPNDSLGVALIGCGGQGMAHLRLLAANEQVRVLYVCDPDGQRRDAAAQAAAGAVPVADFRSALDDDQVHAVWIATPDHWHVPAALRAISAGKHVYLEKPCSHNLKEGRRLVEAARQSGLCVQHGTQSRSSAFIAHGIQLLREGIIGRVCVARAWNVQRRASIGHAQPSEPPAGVDYDLWVGPAPYVPFQANRFHYHWHWWYHFGTGDMGNDGVHELDYARWGLGVDTHPTHVVALGGKYFFDDDQQFPDTQTVVFEYPGNEEVGSQRQLIFEMRLWSANYPYNVDNGAEFLGTDGHLVLSKRGKLLLFDSQGRRADLPAVPPAPPDLQVHHENFLAAIRTGAALAADAPTGHLSASLCHLGNLAARLRRSLQFDPETEQVLGDEEANRLLGRTYRDHWAAPPAG